MKGMSLEEALAARQEFTDRLAREDAEQRFGKTGDALVAHLLRRYDHQRRRADENSQRLGAAVEGLSMLRARYRRLASLLQRPENRAAVHGDLPEEPMT